MEEEKLRTGKEALVPLLIARVVSLFPNRKGNREMRKRVTNAAVLGLLTLFMSGCYSNGRWSMPHWQFWKSSPSQQTFADGYNSSSLPSEASQPGEGFVSTPNVRQGTEMTAPESSQQYPRATDSRPSSEFAGAGYDLNGYDNRTAQTAQPADYIADNRASAGQQQQYPQQYPQQTEQQYPQQRYPQQTEQYPPTEPKSSYDNTNYPATQPAPNDHYSTPANHSQYQPTAYSDRGMPAANTQYPARPKAPYEQPSGSRSPYQAGPDGTLPTVLSPTQETTYPAPVHRGPPNGTMDYRTGVPAMPTAYPPNDQNGGVLHAPTDNETYAPGSISTGMAPSGMPTNVAGRPGSMNFK